MMDDVFEAFRCCITERKCQNHDCPYESICDIANGGSNQYIQIPKHLALDVLNALADGVKHDDALLKEQEAKQAIKQIYHVMMNRDYENPVEVTRYDWLCPTCKSLLCRDIDMIDDNYHFCKVCGQAVKWE